VRECTITPTPAVKGMAMPAYHSNLSQMDIKSAFVTAQAADGADDGVDSRQTIDFEEWQVCLALCGHIKYEEIEEMSLPQKVEGILANYMRGEDESKWGNEHDVITKAVVEPIMRFDASYAAPTGGQPKDEFEVALATWDRMDLGNVHGFPVWEAAVFELIKSNFGEIMSIFSQYSKGSGDGSSAKGAMTMQQTELTELCVDCSIETPDFPMARIIGVFERADQVDEKSKSGAKAGKGDGALEVSPQGLEPWMFPCAFERPAIDSLWRQLHEFCEALVALAFARANPKHGETIGGVVNTEVLEPLPACLESLLSKNILLNAKRDGLQKVKNLLEKDRVVLNKIRKHREPIRELFEAVCKTDKSIKQGHIPKLGLGAYTRPTHIHRSMCPQAHPPTSFPFHPCAQTSSRSTSTSAR
jgi:hypothetical protein